MALLRIIDWSTRAPALPEKQPPLPGMPQKLLRLDGVIIRDSLTGVLMIRALQSERVVRRIIDDFRRGIAKMLRDAALKIERGGR